ncbi:MAG: DUF945 family protein [Halothiobacillaceae bacterium]
MTLARAVLIIAVLSVLAIFVLPYQAGLLAARALQAETGPWRLVASDQNWHASRHLVELSIRGSEHPLRLELDIRHGPRIESGEFGWLFGTVRVTDDSPVQVRDWQDQADWQLRLRAAPAGTVELQPVRLADGGDEAPAGDVIRYDAIRGALHGLVALTGLRVTTPTQSLVFGRTTLDMDLHRVSGDWAGELGLGVSRLGLARETRGWLADGVSLRLRRLLTASGEDLQFNFTLDSFSRSGQTVGPFALLVGARGIASPFWAASQDLVLEVMEALEAGAPLPQTLVATDWSGFLASLESARLNLDALQLNLAQGGLHLHGDIVGPAHRDPLYDRSEDRWRISGQMRVSPALLEQGIDQWLDGTGIEPDARLGQRIMDRLRREGWIAADQGDWISSIHRLDGSWWLNGQLVDAESFAGRW